MSSTPPTTYLSPSFSLYPSFYLRSLPALSTPWPVRQGERRRQRGGGEEGEEEDEEEKEEEKEEEEGEGEEQGTKH